MARISRKLAAAIDALLTGAAKTQREAAHLAGISPESLCRALAKPHVQAYTDQLITQQFGGVGKLLAARRMVKLIDSNSDQVAYNASDRVLKQAGHGVASTGDGSTAGSGFTLNLIFRHHSQAPEVDVTPPKPAISGSV